MNSYQCPRKPLEEMNEWERTADELALNYVRKQFVRIIRNGILLADSSRTFLLMYSFEYDRIMALIEKEIINRAIEQSEAPETGGA